MPIDLNGTLLRYGAVLRRGLLAATNAPTNCDSVTRWFHEQEGLPYWIMRASTFDVLEEDDEYTEDIDVYAYDLTARCLIAPVTAGYTGEWDESLQLWFPSVVEYINSRQLLQSVDYTTPVDHIRHARVVGGVPYGLFPSAVQGVQLLGFEIVTRVEFDTVITQAYL